MSCIICSKGGKLQYCGKCFDAVYCSKECQLEDWQNGHRLVCKPSPKKSTLPTGPENDPFGLTSFAERLNKHFDFLEFPKGRGDFREMLKVREDHVTEALEETQEMAFRVLESRGASREQLTFISEQMEEFESKLRPLVEATISGDDITESAFPEVHAHVEAAQVTVHAINGWKPPSNKTEEDVHVEEMVKIAQRAGSFLARYGLEKEIYGPARKSAMSLRQMPKEEAVQRFLKAAYPTVPIPIGNSLKDILGTIGSYTKYGVQYVTARGYDWVAEQFRNFVYCMGTTKDRTYSQLRRKLSGTQAKKEHDRAIEHLRQHEKLGFVITEAARLLEEAADMLEREALGTDPEKEQLWESKRQAAGILFSIALSTSFGVYTYMNWSKPLEDRDAKVEEIAARNEMLLTNKKQEAIIGEVHDRWNRDFAELQKQNSTFEGARYTAQRSNLFGSVTRKDTSFREAVEGFIGVTTGCNISSTPEISGGGTALATVTRNSLVDQQDINVHVKGFVKHVAEMDNRNVNPTSLGIGTLNLPSSLVETSNVPEPPELECDPSLIQSSFKSLSDTLFAHTASQLRNAKPLPSVNETWHRTQMDRALNFTEAQRQDFEAVFNTIPSTADWAQKHPRALTEMLVTMNKANPNLGASLMASVQESLKAADEKAQSEKNAWNVMKDTAIVAIIDTQQQKDTWRINNAADETWIREQNAILNATAGLTPTNPVTFALGKVSWWMTRLYSKHSTGYQQWQAGVLPSLNVVYDDFATIYEQVYGTPKFKAEVAVSFATFMTKMISLAWWLNIALWQTIAITLGTVAVAGILLWLITKLCNRLWKLFFKGPAHEAHKKSKASQNSRDEGSSVFYSVMEWLWGTATKAATGIAKAPFTFGVVYMFKAFMVVTGGLSLVSLFNLTFLSSITYMGNLWIALKSGALWSDSLGAMAAATVADIPGLWSSFLSTALIASLFTKASTDRFFCIRQFMLLAAGIRSLELSTLQMTVEATALGSYTFRLDSLAMFIWSGWQVKKWVCGEIPGLMSLFMEKGDEEKEESTSSATSSSSPKTPRRSGSRTRRVRY